LSRGWARGEVWQTEDQRFIDHRPDVLTYATEPLADDITVSGRNHRQSVRVHVRDGRRLDREID